MWTWRDRQQVQVYSYLKYTLWDWRFWKHWQLAWLSYGLWHCVAWWMVTTILHPGHNINIQTMQCHNLQDDKMNFYINKFSRLVLLQFCDLQWSWYLFVAGQQHMYCLWLLISNKGNDLLKTKILVNKFRNSVPTSQKTYISITRASCLILLKKELLFIVRSVGNT